MISNPYLYSGITSSHIQIQIKLWVVEDPIYNIILYIIASTGLWTQVPWRCKQMPYPLCYDALKFDSQTPFFSLNWPIVYFEPTLVNHETQKMDQENWFEVAKFFTKKMEGKKKQRKRELEKKELENRYKEN